jgi:hypothetical protein
MHGKCKILRFIIIDFWVMGLCNLTGGYWDFGQNIVCLFSDGL